MTRGAERSKADLPYTERMYKQLRGLLRFIVRLAGRRQVKLARQGNYYGEANIISS